MKYKKYKMHNADVFLIPIKKYKYTVARIMFTMPFSPENRTYNIFLKELLSKGTEHYPTKKDMAKQLDNLYSASGSINHGQVGNTLFLSFSLSFINDKYTEPNMLGKYLELVNEEINHPLLKNGIFDLDKVEEVRRHLKDVLGNMKANPDYIADEMFSDVFMPNTPYSVHELGDEALIDTVTSEELYSYYKRLLEESYIAVYACGNISISKWQRELKKHLKLGGKKQGNYRFHFPQTKNNEVKNIVQDFNTKQSLFYMGFKIEDVSDFENLYVKKIFNYIFGSGPASKLFTTVREKNSLCYTISSSMSPTYDVMTVHSKISDTNKDKVVELINEELDNMKKGNFSLEEVENGKHFFINALLSNDDSLHSMIDAVRSKEIMGIDFPKERIQMVEKITKEDVIKLANKIYPDTIFMLKGEPKDEKN